MRHPRRVLRGETTAAGGLDRRRFLLGGLGATALVAVGACGSDSDDEPGGADTTDTLDDDLAASGGGVALAQLFDPAPTYVRVGAPQRLAFGLSDLQRAPLADQPDELTFQLFADVDETSGLPVGDPIVAPLRDEGLPRGYYPVRFTPDRPGIWLAQTDVAGETLTATFQVGPTDGPGVVPIGAAMPAPVTATDDDDLGVEPLCTRDTPCGLHQRSLSDVVGIGDKPLVVSVATPAYCRTAICGPVLELLLEATPDYTDVTFVHLEPWQAPVPGDPFANGPVAAMGELGLDFEPSLFFVDVDGTIVDRLDHIYDEIELRASLDNLVT